MLINIISFAIAYLVCSLSPAIIICDKVKRKDIRKYGSKNAGTTNAIRVMGKFWGILTFILDILKSIIAYYGIIIICKLFNLEIDISAKSWYLIGAVIGHCYPIYYGFKGGKGIVTVMCSMMIIDTQITVVALIAGIIVIIATKTISIGSISSVILLVIMSFIMLPEYILPIFIVASIIMFKHKENIIRILKNEEKKIF